jgi:hypothetical protein
MEIYVDGGIRRGTDVLKALCLGAKAVGVGRPFLYAQSAYGPDGVVKVVESEFASVPLTSFKILTLLFISLTGRNGNRNAFTGCQLGFRTETQFSRLLAIVNVVYSFTNIALPFYISSVQHLSGMSEP